MAKRSKTSLNIDKINRKLDRIANTFGNDSYEISNYIKENKLQSLELHKTKSGKIHIRDTAANRKHYQRISAVSKKPVKRFIAKSKARYKTPKVAKSPIPPQLPEKPTPKQIKDAAKQLATWSEIYEYVYTNHPELNEDDQKKLTDASFRKHPTNDNLPAIVEATYTELYSEFFADDIDDEFEAAEDFENPDFFL